MKMNFLLSEAVFLTLLALACPWRAAAEKQETKLLLPAQAVDTGCEAFIKRNKISDTRGCAVSETGTIGNVDGQDYDYALYHLDLDGLSASGLSIFFHTSSNKQVNLLFDRYDEENAGVYIYEKPAIAKHSFGTLLEVPVRMDGTGQFNENEYYLWSEKQKGWKLLDSTNWVDDLGKRLPPDLSIWKGVWPDIKTMTATTSLWRRDDGNCCPSGGTATVKLKVKDGRFVTKSVDMALEEGSYSP